MKISNYIPISLVILLFQCQTTRDSEQSCKNISFPKNINMLNKIEEYKEAQWHIYKHTLLESDDFVVRGFDKKKEDYTEKKLSEFDLDFFILEKIGDTTSYTFFFEKGVSSHDSKYFYTASLWSNKDSIAILSGRFQFTYPKNLMEKEFEQYLVKNNDRVSPTLKCLATEKGIFQTE